MFERVTHLLVVSVSLFVWSWLGRHYIQIHQSDSGLCMRKNYLMSWKLFLSFFNGRWRFSYKMLSLRFWIFLKSRIKIGSWKELITWKTLALASLYRDSLVTAIFRSLGNDIIGKTLLIGDWFSTKILI